MPGIDAPEALGTADGVTVWRAPTAALRDDPMMWGVWDEWRLGGRIRPRPSEYTALSAWHLECLNTLRMARYRERDRRTRAMRESPGDGP